MEIKEVKHNNDLLRYFNWVINKGYPIDNNDDYTYYYSLFTRDEKITKITNG